MPDGFWPTTLIGWLTVFFVYGAAIVSGGAALLKWLVRPMFAQVHELKESDFAIRTQMQTLVGAVDLLERTAEAAERESRIHREEMTELRRKHAELVDLIRLTETAALTDARTLEGRLSKIETLLERIDRRKTNDRST